MEETVANFQADPVGLSGAHATALKRYNVFCRNRTTDLYLMFFRLVGEQDLSWCEEEAVFRSSFKANVPFPGKKNERDVSGCVNHDKQMHGLVRYEYKGNIIEECYKHGRYHGLRVVCTQMGDIWIRIHKNGIRLAQIVLNADLSEQFTIDDGGLKKLREKIPMIAECFIN